jgi:hypothetical protein
MSMGQDYILTPVSNGCVTHSPDNYGEKLNKSKKTCPSATLPTTRTGPSENPGPRIEKPSTEELCHGTAKLCFYSLSNDAFSVTEFIYRRMKGW